ncbi:MAG: HAD family hydrolase [Gemmataceae bacterium]
MKRAAIWDMDGTLVDTAELHFAAWVAACRDLGRDFTRGDFAATFGKRNPEIFAVLFGPDRFTRAEIDRLGADKEDRYKVEARRGVELLPGVRALMDGLHRLGFGQAIGTSAPRGNLELILELTGVGPLLGAAVAEQDTTRGKPDPQVFLLGAERLGVDPARCVVFEDAVYGVQAAKAGGMKAVGVTFVGHSTPEALRAAGADVVVRSLEELSAHDVARLIGT